MDLLKSHKRRSRLSEAAYIALNIGLAIALFVIVRAVQTPWLALLIVLLSKWRALAVRPRFWFANLVANMVDIIVGISVVVLLYAAEGQTWLQVLITVFYAVWLLVIKPRSKRTYVATQAGIAVFLGVTSLSILSYAWDVTFFVLGMWLIGYVTARHILGSYDEPHTTLYSLITGFIFAELGWIGFHWLMAYQPALGFGSVKLSQLAVFTTLFSLIAERAYASYHRFGEVRRTEIILPIILTVAIMVAMYAFAVLKGTDALL
jgi:hypothetical protein